MRKLSNIAVSLAFLSFMFALNSCQEATDPISNSDIVLEEFSPAELPIVDDFIGELRGGDLNIDFYIIHQDEQSINSKKDKTQCGDKDKKKDKYKKKHHRKGCKNGINPLGKILRKLGLTKEQKKAIKDFKHDYRDCLKWAKKQIRNREREIIKNANKEKCKIKKQYKNGEITKQEAKEALKRLQNQIKNRLRNCVKDEIKDCVCEYLNNIITVLDETQVQTFIDYITTEHPEFNCDFDTGGDDDDNGGGDTPPPPPPDEV